MYYSTAAITLLTDVAVLVLPIPQVLKLNLNRRRKCTVVPSPLQTASQTNTMRTNSRPLSHLPHRYIRNGRLDRPRQRPARLLRHPGRLLRRHPDPAVVPDRNQRGHHLRVRPVPASPLRAALPRLIVREKRAVE